MSRRPIAPRIVQSVGAGRRMAPGGRLWSESKIRPLWRPVGEAGQPPSGYYVDVEGSGTEGSSSGLFWYLWWPPVSLGGQQPEAGWYDITFSFQLTAVHPTATFIHVYTETFTWPLGEDFYDVTGGPFTVGQVVTFTIPGYIDPAYSNEIDLFRVAASGPCEWNTALTTDHFTVVPIPEPVAVSDVRPTMRGAENGSQ